MNGLIIGRRCVFALFAVEMKAEHPFTSTCRCHPVTMHPGWIVAHMLIVTTRKLSNPVSFVVRVIANDRLLHRYQPTGRHRLQCLLFLKTG